MQTRIDAKEAARDLAIEGLSPAAIRKRLEELGFGAVLDQTEIEAIVTEARTARNLLPRQPSRILPRVIGVIAILMGIGGMALGGFPYGRYSPQGYGFWAVILGAILVIKPGWSNESLK